MVKTVTRLKGRLHESTNSEDQRTDR
jgi:hypothetical protein